MSSREYWSTSTTPGTTTAASWAVMRRTPDVLLIHERKTPHLLIGMSEFDGDIERKNDYCKVQFAEGVVTDAW